MHWYIEVLKKYAVFTGRARRKEIWMFSLISILISIALTLVDGFTGLYSAETGLGVLSSIYSLAILIPSISVGVRRFHDIGRSGWWMLIILIPLIGLIVVLIFCLLDSAPGDNEYGPNPKEAQANAT